MKCLPMWEPWATLVAIGVKGIETRPEIVKQLREQWRAVTVEPRFAPTPLFGTEGGTK